jgi:hypothetical protein
VSEQPPVNRKRRRDGIDLARLRLDRLGTGRDRRRVGGIGRAAQRGLVLHELAEGGGRSFGARGMHGIEPGEQPPDEARPFRSRQRAVELADRGGRRLEHVEDVFEGGKAGYRRAEAPPSLGVEFVDPVSNGSSRYYGLSS